MCHFHRMLFTQGVPGAMPGVQGAGLGGLSMFRVNGFDPKSWNFVKTALSYQVHGLPIVSGLAGSVDVGCPFSRSAHTQLPLPTQKAGLHAAERLLQPSPRPHPRALNNKRGVRGRPPGIHRIEGGVSIAVRSHPRAEPNN